MVQPRQATAEHSKTEQYGHKPVCKAWKDLNALPDNAY